MAPEPHRRTSDLPPEIHFSHILPRLPVKSILRFKCVSKEWLSFLKSPVFIKTHLDHHVTNSDHQNHRRFLFSSAPTTPVKFTTIDCEAPEDGLSICRTLPFEATSYKKMHILASFHGLVCVAIMNDDVCDLILWNPVTGDHKTLSKGSPCKRCYDHVCNKAFGLYYSSSDQDYKLLHITEEDHQACIYSLNSDSWRKVKAPSRSMLDFWVVKGCLNLYAVGRGQKAEVWRMDGDGDGEWTELGSCYIPADQSMLHLTRNGDWLMDSRDGLHKMDSKTGVSSLVCPYAHSSFFMPFIRAERFIDTLVSPNLTIKI